LRSIRASFLYYLTIAVAVFGIAALCIPFFNSLAPAADNSAPVIEFDLTSLAEGEHVRLNVLGKLIYIRHRSLKDIEAVHASYDRARYQERDIDRLLGYKGHKDPKYIILEGQIGPWCFVSPNSGDYKDQGGWACFPRASHFDGSGRIQKGPDSSNLKVPRNARYSSMTTVQFFEHPIVELPD